MTIAEQSLVEKFGREIPVKKIIDIITLCADADTNQLLQQLCDELLRHFTNPAKRSLVGDDPLAEIERAMIALRAAGYGEGRRGCHTCGGELVVKGYIDNQPIYGCPKCGGVDKRELIR